MKNSLIEAAKRSYYEKLIKTNSNNSSQAWSAIKEIIDCKQPNKILPSTISINDQQFDTHSKYFLDQLCDYFANIGASMSNKITQNVNSSFKIHSKRCVHSLALHEVNEQDVSACINTPDSTVITRGGVEDTRLEAKAKAKDTKKIRGQGQGQGQPFRGQNLSRPRTEMLEAKAKDQGHRRKCSPKKKSSKIFFRRSPIRWRTQNLLG